MFATHRLEHTEPGRVARTLSAWSVTSKATIAALTALWGLLASVTGPRIAIAVAGLLILATPLALPRHAHAPQPQPEPGLGRTARAVSLPGGHATTGGAPESVAIGRPAAAQSCMPPATLTACQPAPASACAARAERAPDRQIT